MRTLSQTKVAQIEALVRVGASARGISAAVGCAKNTALRHIALMLELAPVCRHGVVVYRCPQCVAGRRTTEDGKLVVCHGPQRHG